MGVPKILCYLLENQENRSAWLPGINLQSFKIRWVHKLWVGKVLAQLNSSPFCPLFSLFLSRCPFFIYSFNPFFSTFFIKFTDAEWNTGYIPDNGGYIPVNGVYISVMGGFWFIVRWFSLKDFLRENMFVHSQSLNSKVVVSPSASDQG